MRIEINIEDCILDQFHNQLKTTRIKNSLALDENIGNGQINLVNFPNTLNFIHFTFNLKQELEIHSRNPRNELGYKNAITIDQGIEELRLYDIHQTSTN